MTSQHYLSILKGAGIAIGGALLTYLLGQLPGISFGVYTSAATALLSILINAGLQWLKAQQTPPITISGLQNDPSQITK